MKSVFRSSHLLKPLCAALILATLDSRAAGPVTPPDTGSILREVQPSMPPTPAQNKRVVKIEPNGSTSLPSTLSFEIKSIRVTGNTEIDTGTLHALVVDQEGKTLTLPQLNEAASRITRYYQGRGFPLARAVIPAQTISDGVVVIQVIEARYGKIFLNNSSQVHESLLNATLASLQSGRPMSERELDRALLLLSDIPEVGVNAILKPGTEVGTSDMEVDASRSSSTLGSLVLDNYGNRYIGRARLSGMVNIINPFHRGDILSVSGTTTGDGMAYGRISYDTLVNGEGTRIGGAYSKVRYELGSSARSLDAHGTADVVSAWAKHPFIRSKQVNLYAQLQYDSKQLEDRINASKLQTDRHLNNWVLSLNGDVRDTFLGGGISAWSLGWTSGRVSFDDAAAQTSDAASARTRGGFSKWNANFSRLQGLSERNSLYLNVAWQWADSNLDSAEKVTAGGPYSVRAYDIGAASGDTGYQGSIEFRHDFGMFAGGQLQASAFIDSAHVNVNRHPWANGANSGTLSGAGIGLTWSGPYLSRVSASIASRIGSIPNLVSAPDSTQAWVAINRAF